MKFNTISQIFLEEILKNIQSRPDAWSKALEFMKSSENPYLWFFAGKNK
jgi:hypothetical protein